MTGKEMFLESQFIEARTYNFFQELVKLVLVPTDQADWSIFSDHRPCG